LTETEETPLARWEAGAAGVHYPEPARLVNLFLWEEKRRVDKSGCIQLSGNSYPVVGRQVVVRFDPFDLSRIRLYEKGQFSQVLEPQTLVSRTFRKALPRKRKEDPTTLDSSAAYRDRLAKDFRDRARDTASQVRGRGNGCLSQGQFFAVLEECLGGRKLTSAEAKWVEDFYVRQAPFLAGPIRTALQKAVEAKGNARHVRYYLDAIQDSRLDGRDA